MRRAVRKGRPLYNEHYVAAGGFKTPKGEFMSSSHPDGLSRRLVLGGLAALPALPGLLDAGAALAQTAAPLASWNDGPAKDAILAFVRATTDSSSPNFVPAEERIATFDQDGTLWVEHPIYTQVVYCFDRVPAVVKEKPDLANEEPFKTVLSGNREAIAKLSMDDLIKIATATLTGMDVDAFRDEAAAWIDAARDPRWKRPYTDLTYLPQDRAPDYLRANGYKTYIVTGGGQDFVRVYAERSTAFRPSRWSAAPAASVTVMQRTGGRCSSRSRSCC